MNVERRRRSFLLVPVSDARRMSAASSEADGLRLDLGGTATRGARPLALDNAVAAQGRRDLEVIAAARPHAGRHTGREPGVRAALVALLALFALGAAAAGWGTITPGESTTAGVKAEHGEPSKVAKLKAGGYDTTEWTYEGDRAPVGMTRMVVEFGLLTRQGYQPDVVRAFRIEPKPGVFSRDQVIVGWGKPEKGGIQDGVPFMMYNSGLVVYFDKDILNAVSMWFTRPFPAAGAEGSTPTPAPAAPPTRPPEAKPKPPDRSTR
jgi:hypothetical protein